MSDPTDPGRVTGSHERTQRNNTRVGDSGSPVGSPLTIVLAVIAVVAGFLIFRSISDDGAGVAGLDGGAGTTLPVVTDPTGAVVSTLAGQVTTPTVTVAPTRAGATVVVANASSTGQVAAPMSEQLAALGYTMGEPTSQAAGDDYPNLDTSIVYFEVGNNSEAVARQLGLDMGGLTVEPMPDPPPVEGGVASGPVVLMLGNDLAGEDVPGPGPTTPAIPSTPTSTTQPA